TERRARRRYCSTSQTAPPPSPDCSPEAPPARDTDRSSTKETRLSDQAGVGIDSVPQATAYAIRAWYTSMLSQTQAVRQDLASKVEAMKLEMQQVTSQIERADKSIASLE